LEPEIAFIRDEEPLIVLYLWNLVRPDLKSEVAGEGIYLLRQQLSAEISPAQFGIFNLRTNKIIGEAEVRPTSAAKLERDLAVIEALWIDIQDESMTTEDVLTHIETLKLPPPTPPAM
jgi:hypothetical protein